MTIENIGAYMDLIQAHIATLWLTFSIYSGKPVTVPTWVYWYFRLENNSEKVWDDSSGTNIKEASFDFVIASWDKSTPDADMYLYLNQLSNVLVTESWTRIVLDGWFTIYSVQEWAQSWVLRDVNENPYLIWQYKFIYQYRYASTPRI